MSSKIRCCNQHNKYKKPQHKKDTLSSQIHCPSATYPEGNDRLRYQDIFATTMDFKNNEYTEKASLLDFTLNMIELGRRCQGSNQTLEHFLRDDINSITYQSMYKNPNDEILNLILALNSTERDLPFLLTRPKIMNDESNIIEDVKQEIQLFTNRFSYDNKRQFIGCNFDIVCPIFNSAQKRWESVRFKQKWNDVEDQISKTIYFAQTNEAMKNEYTKAISNLLDEEYEKCVAKVNSFQNTKCEKLEVIHSKTETIFVTLMSLFLDVNAQQLMNHSDDVESWFKSVLYLEMMEDKIELCSVCDNEKCTNKWFIITKYLDKQMNKVTGNHEPRFCSRFGYQCFGSLEKQEENHKNVVADLQSKYDESLNQVVKKEEELAKMKKDLDCVIAQMQNELETSKTENATINETVKKVQEKRDNAMAEMKKEHKGSLEKQEENHKNVVADLQSKYDESLNQVVKKEEELAKMKKDLDCVIAQMQNELETSKTENATINEDVKKVQEERDLDNLATKRDVGDNAAHQSTEVNKNSSTTHSKMDDENDSFLVTGQRKKVNK